MRLAPEEPPSTGGETGDESPLCPAPVNYTLPLHERPAPRPRLACRPSPPVFNTDSVPSRGVAVCAVRVRALTASRTPVADAPGSPCAMPARTLAACATELRLDRLSLPARRPVGFAAEHPARPA